MDNDATGLNGLFRKILQNRLNEIFNVPVQIIKQSKQNSCEHVGITVLSSIGCKQILQFVSESSSCPSTATGEASPSSSSCSESSNLNLFEGGLVEGEFGIESRTSATLTKNEVLI